MRGLNLFAATLSIIVIFTMTHAANAATQYSVANGATVTIDEFGVCKDVTNNHASGNSIMCPTNSANEWYTGGNSFLENLPTGVTAANCAAGGSITCGSFQANTHCTGSFIGDGPFNDQVACAALCANTADSCCDYYLTLFGDHTCGVHAGTGTASGNGTGMPFQSSAPNSFTATACSGGTITSCPAPATNNSICSGNTLYSSSSGTISLSGPTMCGRFQGTPYCCQYTTSTIGFGTSLKITDGALTPVSPGGTSTSTSRMCP